MSLLGIARPVGRHRAADEVARLREALAEAAVRYTDLSRRYAEATAARDAANAKANRLSEAEENAAEATRQLADREAEIAALKAALANATAVSDRPARSAVVETQPIPIVESRAIWPLGEAATRGLL
ncbi:hypothetical protein ACFXJO_05820 [Streptomyces lavendulae]|uniref:hypothetical protein n=1 Tax=Streptomyces lavendulae TaxID=1914 RepID=UPI0036CE2B2F